MKSVAISISFRLKCSLMTFELFSKSSEAFNRNRPKKSNLKCNSSAYAMLCDYKKCENQWCLSADVTDVMHLETTSLNMFCCEFQTLIFGCTIPLRVMHPHLNSSILALFLNKVFPLIHTKFCLCLIEICFMALTCLYLKPAK